MEKEIVQSELQEMEGVYNLKLLLKGQLIFEMPISIAESLGELRCFISELPEMYFYPRYFFEYQGARIQEMADLQSCIGTPTTPDISVRVVPDDYDLRSMKSLIQKANSFFSNPKSVIATHKYNQNDTLGRVNFFDILNVKKKKKSKSKAKISIERVLDNKLDLLSQIARSPSLKIGSQVPDKFVEDVEFSTWNPPPQRRKIIGDYFYLKVTTLEGSSFHATAFSKGFYVNRCTDESFDPSAESEVFYSILELIAYKSSSFKGKLELGLFSDLNLDIKNIELPVSCQPQKWLKQEENIDDHHRSGFRAGEAIYSTYGYDPVVYRDWNEEMINAHQCKEEAGLTEVANFKKVEYKIQQNFLDAAIQGAQAIIDGDLVPFNLFVPASEQCFVHNNIFYTYACDEYLNLKQPKGDSAVTTLTHSLIDLRNIGYLKNNKAGGPLKTISTALVQYKGQTMVAQAMIQGILHFDNELWSKYGTMEDSKVIRTDPEFAKHLKKINELFGVQDEHIYVDGEGKEVQLQSSPDIKGIQGGDRRLYLLDVQRLSPRDLNWKSAPKNKEGEGSEQDSQKEEEEEFNMCVFRPEILKHFELAKKMEVIREVKASFDERIEKNKVDNLLSVQESQKAKKEEIIKNLTTSTKEDGTNKKEGNETAESVNIKDKKLPQIELDEEEKTKIENYKSENIKISQEIDTKVKELLEEKGLNNLRFNQCLSVGSQNYKISAEQKAKDMRLLEELAEFAKGPVVNKVLHEWVTGPKSTPIDSESVSAFIHKFGLNLRYLGFIADRVNKESTPSISITLRRTILVRSFKHLLNEAMRESDTIQTASTVIHLLNCLLGSRAASSQLTKRATSMQMSSVSSQGSNDKKKSKKKKKKRNLKQVDCDLLPNQYLSMTPEQAFRKIKEICAYRFNYTFKETYFYELEFCQSDASLTSLMREVARACGLLFRMKDYEFRGGISHLPLEDIDLIGFEAKVKHSEVVFTEVFKNLELAHQAFTQSNTKVASDLFQYSLSLSVGVAGPFTAEAIEIASSITSMVAMQRESDTAISMQKMVVQMAEKTFGIDSVQTIRSLKEITRFYTHNKSYEQAIQTLLKTQYLSDLVGGEYNTESLRILEELQILFLEEKNYQQAIKCCHEKKNRLERMFDQSNINIVRSYQKLSGLNYQHKDYSQALECLKNKLKLLEKYHSEKMAPEIQRTNQEIEMINALIKQSLPQNAPPVKKEPIQAKKEPEKPKISLDEVQEYKQRLRIARNLKKGGRKGRR